MATESVSANIEISSNTENKKVKSKKKESESHTEQSVEVEATVKIEKPQKTISTAVQIERKILPNGTVEETKTTTTNTLINGKVEDSKVQKETRILSDEEAKAVIEEGSEEEEEIVEEENEKVNRNSQNTKTNGNAEVSITETTTGSKKSTTSKTTEETRSENRTQSTSTTNSTTKGRGNANQEEIEEVVVTEYENEVDDHSNQTVTGSKKNVSETQKNAQKNAVGSKLTGTSETQVTKTTKVTTTTAGDSGDEEIEEEEEEEVEEEEEEVVEENVTRKNTEKKETTQVQQSQQSSIKKQTTDARNSEITQTDTKINSTTVSGGKKDTEEEEEEEEYEEVEEVEEEEEVEEDVTKKTESKDVKDIKSQQQTVLSTVQDKKADEKRAQNVTEESTQITTEEEIVESGSNKNKIDEKRIHKVTEESTQIKTDISTEKPIEIHIAKSVNEKENTQTKKQTTTTTKSETVTSTGAPQVHSTKQTETSEIVSTLSDTPFPHPISTQTELHRIENIITVNKTTKSLDNSYEQMTQQGLPTVKTYFAPSRERISTSPQPSKPYTPTFSAPEKQPERRHSLLLERLSMERQFASPENFHNTYNYSSNHTNETSSNQWTQEPQSEVVIASNVKPSSINNSQWYNPSIQQSTQSNQQNNVIYNNVKPETPTPQKSWQQPTFDHSSYSAPVHQPEPSYAPKPSSWGSSNLSNLDRLPSLSTQTNDYSFMNNKSTLNQENTQTQQYHSGYVPPPWEADNVSYKQPSYYEPQTAPVLPSNSAPTWNAPTLEAPKKRTPVSYQPPAPNASFVKQASPAPSSKSLPGRKTYYSEYERRYISVPESTYVPSETKVQPQWDASPQYYYDNSEPAEEVEPPWRKELREFTEKSTREDTTTFVQPPWQDNKNYANNMSQTTSTQQTWSQTLRPKSWRETSYEPEALQSSQEWPRSQSKRPISAYVNQGLNSPSVERTRGVSVDRYNSNNYQSPGFAPSSSNGYSFPWESQEQASLSPQPQRATLSSSTYHNPQVPAYHSRPTESRDYQVSYQPRWSGQGREKPVQSRSFKYLQMLTGTEDGFEEPEPFVVQQAHHAVTKPRRI